MVIVEIIKRLQSIKVIFLKNMQQEKKLKFNTEKIQEMTTMSVQSMESHGSLMKMLIFYIWNEWVETSGNIRHESVSVTVSSMPGNKSLVCISFWGGSEPVIFSCLYRPQTHVLVITTSCKELTKYYAMKIAPHFEPSTKPDCLSRTSLTVESQGYCRSRAQLLFIFKMISTHCPRMWLASIFVGDKFGKC